jgi:hypothetical protein
MTSQATNRREGGSRSCCCRSQKLHAFTEKELETVRAAQELPIIGVGGVPGQGVVVKRAKEAKKKPFKSPGMYKNGWFTALNNLNNAKNAVFFT